MVVSAGGADSSIVWRPSDSRAAHANLTRFMAYVNARHSLELNDYPQLYDWSIASPADFWAAIASFSDVKADWGEGPALERRERMPEARFFPTARLNFAENVLAYRDSRPALIFRNERGKRAEMSFAELYCEVARVANGLVAMGVSSGDRVAGFIRKHSGGRRCRARDCELRCNLVVVFARFWSTGGARPLRANQTESPDLRRWLPLRRQGF